MDEIFKILDQIENEPKTIENDDLYLALEHESSLLYLLYSLEIVEQKLTNKIDKKTFEKIGALRTNFQMCKDKKMTDKEFLENLYKTQK